MPQIYRTATLAIATLLGVIFFVTRVHAAPIYVSEVFSGNIKLISETGVVTTFATGLSNPTFLATSSNGDLYASTPGASSISRITPAGVTSTFFAGIPDPHGIAIGNDGTVYAASGSEKTISSITPAGVRSLIATLATTPLGVSLNKANGDLFVSTSDNELKRITPLGVVSVFATGVDFSGGLVIAPNGNFYASNGSFVAASASDGINQITPLAVVSPFASIASLSPLGLAVDADNQLYAANLRGNSVSKIGPDGRVSVLATGLDSPYGVAVVAPVPEPGTWALIFCSVPGAWLILVRRRSMALAR